MARFSYDFVLWAVPRFQRALPLPQHQELVAGNPAASTKLHSVIAKQADYRSEAIAEAIAEHSDGAAHLYGRH